MAAMTTSSTLETISNNITECMDKDEQPWDYYEQLQSSQNGRYDYNSHRLIKFNELPVPKAITDSINHQITVNNNNKYFGGFFESINRAYFVVHSCIFLWDYSSKSRWCCLNQFNDAITAICLVESKKNIFIDKIQYLLIVATKIEIVIIGIGFTNDSINGEIEAFPTKYKISTDNVIITKIISDRHTKRIFLSCNHGNVYEFEYLYKQNMFGQHIRKCIKKNISDSFTSSLFKSFSFPSNYTLNNDSNHCIIDLIIHSDIFYTKCLFSLSQNGQINGYKFDDISEPITKILSYNKLFNELQLQIQQMTDDNRDGLRSINDLKIISLHCIDKYESSQCQLMGITTNGDRLFFSLSQRASSVWNMELSFIRIRAPFLNYNHNNENSSFEPSIQPSSSPRNIDCSFHSDGVTLMNSLRNNNADSLLLISRNNVESIKSKYYHRNQLIESIESDIVNRSRDVNNLILSLCAMPRDKYLPNSSFMLYSRKEIKKMNFARPFIGLNPFAIQHLLPCSIYLCLRQKSIVFYKLQRYIDQFKLLLKLKNYENIVKFIDKIGLIECEVMALLIIISKEEDGDEESNSIIAEAYKLFMTPINNKTDLLYQDIMQRLGLNSTKRLSMLLCLSRILRPIWSSTICILNLESNNTISSRFSVDELYRIINPLISAKKMMLTIKNDDILLKWIAKCIEIINILIMLSRCHFNSIYSALSNEYQNLLKHICFEQLMTKECGTDLLRQIISLIINKLSDSDIKRLHSECPTYFTSAQLVTFLAKSQLNDKSQLQNALKMFCGVCHDIGFDLNEVCNLLRNANYYHGVVQLVFCLQNKLLIKIAECRKQQIQIAQVHQIQSVNSHLFGQDNRMQNIQNEMKSLNNRIVAAWNEIFECLRILYIENHIQNQQFISHSKQRVLRLCLMETNRDFAYKLYEWFLDNKLIQMLFEHKPRYLEEFLSENNNNSEENDKKERGNRLIKLVYYYKENGEINKMIQLLDALTKSSGFELEERHNFLIEAKRATKLLTNSNKGNVFDPHNAINDKYNKFEEKSMLCQIQLNVFNELRSDENELNVENEHLFDLNYKLLNLDKIYLISKQYELYEYALDCLSFSNDCSAQEHINGCWVQWIGNVVKKHKTEWSNYLLNNLYVVVNKYNIEQQPWMFDLQSIALFLNNLNYQTHQKPDNKVIIDSIYPKIKKIKYIDMIDAYKSILIKVNIEHKINIIESIYYLLSEKQQQNNSVSEPKAMDLFRNPRLNVKNNNLNNSNLSFISSTSNIQDLISNSLNYLERQNNNNNMENTQIIQELIKKFQELSEQYSL